MPPKKTVKTVAKAEPKETQFSNDDSDNESIDTPTTIVPLPKPIKTTLSKPNVYISQKLTDSTSDRLQLAQALNNFTIKSDQFMQEMKNFESFKENVAHLDILIETKKAEHAEIAEQIDLAHKQKVKNLETEFAELSKRLNVDNAERTKKMESEFNDKKKMLTIMHEDEQISMRRRIADDKVKTCESFAKEFSMRFIKEEEYRNLVSNVEKVVSELNDLKKTFTSQCDAIRSDEKAKYQNQLKIELTTNDLNNKIINADYKAQVEQQKKEITVLNQTIQSLKDDIREQRELTKEVAQASSKSQINQTIGKN
jgi:hypothetical protein